MTGKLNFVRDMFGNNGQDISVEEIVLRCADEYKDRASKYTNVEDVVLDRLKDIEYPRGVKLIGGALNAAFKDKEFTHGINLERNQIRRSSSVLDISNAFVAQCRAKGKENPNLANDLLGMRYDDAVFMIGAGYEATRKKYCLAFR